MHAAGPALKPSLQVVFVQSTYSSCLWDSSGRSTDNDWEINIHYAQYHAVTMLLGQLFPVHDELGMCRTVTVRKDIVPCSLAALRAFVLVHDSCTGADIILMCWGTVTPALMQFHCQAVKLSGCSL